MSSNRVDQDKCGKLLHDWESNKRLNTNTGRYFCGACDDERRAAVKAGLRDSHPQNSGHCRKGHPYTPENTVKVARIRAGKKVIERSCRRCNLDNKLTRR